VTAGLLLSPPEGTKTIQTIKQKITKTIQTRIHKNNQNHPDQTEIDLKKWGIGN